MTRSKLGTFHVWAARKRSDQPGPVGATEMFHAVIPAGSEQERALARSIPMGRLGKPEDVANAVLFFASPNSSFVTGQTLYVCGGSSVGTVPV